MTRGADAARAARFVLFGLLLLAGCTFEPRGNGNESEAGAEGAEAGAPMASEDAKDPSVAVVDVLRAFREATASGDLSLALALMDRDAVLADEIVGGSEVGETRGELLLALRARLRGRTYREEATEVTIREETAFVFTRLTLRVPPDEELDGEGEEPPPERLLETAVLVPSDGGWRIRHLHRSVVDRR